MDIVFPKPGTEKAIADMASRLGVTDLVFCYELNSSNFKEKKKLVEGLGSLGQIVTHTTRKVYPVLKVLVDSQNPRAAFEQSKADIVLNLETQKQSDFLHHRASGLNHVIAKIGAKRKIKYGINFSNMLNARTPTEFGRLWGRIKQNIRLARKAGLEVVWVSGAKDEWGLRVLSFQ